VTISGLSWPCRSPVMTNRHYSQLYVLACVLGLSLSARVSADPLNFAADQAEIEIFHGLKKTVLRENGDWGRDGEDGR